MTLIEPLEAVVDSVEAEGREEEDLPHDSLAIVDLADLSVTRMADVRSFRLPEDGDGVPPGGASGGSLPYGSRARPLPSRRAQDLGLGLTGKGAVSEEQGGNGR